MRCWRGREWRDGAGNDTCKWGERCRGGRSGAGSRSSGGIGGRSASAVRGIVFTFSRITEAIIGDIEPEHPTASSRGGLGVLRLGRVGGVAGSILLWASKGPKGMSVGNFTVMLLKRLSHPSSGVHAIVNVHIVMMGALAGILTAYVRMFMVRVRTYTRRSISMSSSPRDDGFNGN